MNQTETKPNQPRRRNRSRRMHRLELRLSSEELSGIDEKRQKTNQTRSEFVRSAVLRVRTWTAKDRQSYRERTRELARIGNNLNQIARWCNVNKSAADSVEVISHLQAISQELEVLKND